MPSAIVSANARAEGYLMEAIASPFGTGIIVSDLTAAKRFLYTARKSLAARGVPTDHLTIRTSIDNPAFELWIMKDPAKMAPPSDPSDPAPQPSPEATPSCPPSSLTPT